MARPKSNTPNKAKLNLTVSKEAKAMLDLIRTQKGVSISEWVEEIVRKEVKRLQRAGDIPALPDADQLNMDDVLKGE